MDIQAWARQNKGLLGAVAVGGLAGAFMLLRKKTTATGTTSAGTVTTAATSQPAYGSAGYYDSTASDLYNALTPQIQGLQQQLAAIQPGPVSSPTTTTDAGSQLYTSWWANGGQAATNAQFGAAPAGTQNWGQAAAAYLGPNATLGQVEAESLVLQQHNAGLAASNPFFIPTSSKLTP